MSELPDNEWIELATGVYYNGSNAMQFRGDGTRQVVFAPHGKKVTHIRCAAGVPTDARIMKLDTGVWRVDVTLPAGDRLVIGLADET